MSARREIAARLRSARKRVGLSQQAVADALGLHRPAVTEIEAARRRVDLVEADRLADVYGVSVQWIATGERTAVDRATDEVMDALGRRGRRRR